MIIPRTRASFIVRPGRVHAVRSGRFSQPSPPPQRAAPATRARARARLRLAESSRRGLPEGPGGVEVREAEVLPLQPPHELRGIGRQGLARAEAARASRQL